LNVRFTCLSEYNVCEILDIGKPHYLLVANYVITLLTKLMYCISCIMITLINVVSLPLTDPKTETAETFDYPSDLCQVLSVYVGFIYSYDTTM